MTGMDGTDAQKATSLVKKYLVDTYGSLAEYSFRILSVEKNTNENIWIVKSQIYTTPKDNAPTEYIIKVNIKTGEFNDVKSLSK